MKPHRFTFADEYEKTKAPPSVWVTRMVITGLIASAGAIAYIAGHLQF